MLISELAVENLTDGIIDRVLFNCIKDTGEIVDCIVVLGSAKACIYRVPVAAKAYHDIHNGRFTPRTAEGTSRLFEIRIINAHIIEGINSTSQELFDI